MKKFMFRIAMLGVFLSAVCIVSPAQCTDLDLEGRQLRAADATFMWALVNYATPNIRERCKEERFTCLEGVAGELAMALIASRDTPQSRTALVRLMRFKLDAGYGEDFGCFALTKGKGIRSLLRGAKPANLREECEADIRKVLKDHGEIYEGLNADAVCAKPESIHARVTELVDAIDQKVPCPF